MTTDLAISLLLLNGGLVFFMGMLVGVPYGVLRVRGASEKTLDNWRISHAQNLQNGFLLLIVGLCAPYLELSSTCLAAMVYLLIVAVYCDMGAWWIRPLTGHPGFTPEPPVLNTLAFALFNLTLLGQFAGMSLFIYGAWARWASSG